MLSRLRAPASLKLNARGPPDDGSPGFGWQRFCRKYFAGDRLGIYPRGRLPICCITAHLDCIPHESGIAMSRANDRSAVGHLDRHSSSTGPAEGRRRTGCTCPVARPVSTPSRVVAKSSEPGPNRRMPRWGLLRRAVQQQWAAQQQWTAQHAPRRPRSTPTDVTLSDRQRPQPGRNP